MLTLKGTQVSIRLCTMFLVSSSVDVSVFFILHGRIPSGQTSYIELLIPIILLTILPLLANLEFY